MKRITGQNRKTENRRLRGILCERTDALLYLGDFGSNISGASPEEIAALIVG